MIQNRAKLQPPDPGPGRFKQQRIITTARHFLMTHPRWANQPLRFDVVAIDGIDRAPRIHWIRAAFERSPSGVDDRLLGSELFAPVRTDPSFTPAVERIQNEARARVLEMRRSIESPL